MAYYLNLFSPETYQAFSASERAVSGFRLSQRTAANRIQPGDRLICYLTRLSRWIGIFEVLGPPVVDSTPVFLPENDPFDYRFPIRVVAWLDPRHGIPIHDAGMWEHLSFTREHDGSSSAWTGKLRSSLGRIDDDDAAYLEQRLLAQSTSPVEYPLSDRDLRLLETHLVRRTDKLITVSVPDDADEPRPAAAEDQGPVRESTQIQALVARIGADMGMKIWIPKADRGNVLAEWPEGTDSLFDTLPLNYNEPTLKTIEQIDVIWMKGQSIVRAFEVEHTTSIYSGILRMADLLALQPNMDIRLHIVAPPARREKVFQEIRRPVFSLLERRPLSESCTFLSYDAIRELSEEKHLTHLSDSVLEEFEERVE